jgi:hydrogenase maturation factor
MVPCAMALASFPVAHIEVSIVEKTLAISISQVILPLTDVLVIATLFFVRTDIGTIAITNIAKDLPLISIAIMVIHNSLAVFTF